ncbi:hypothetical protein ACQ4PT_049746 [Festuca glaucescens]
MFALFRPRATCEGRIVYANKNGESGLYNADKHVHTILGVLNAPKGISPVCLSTVPHPGTNQDSMYVLDRFPGKANGRCFEVLEPVSSHRELGSNLMMPALRWRLLPPPPFIRQPGYRPSSITAYGTVVHGNSCSTIYVSCDGGIGTYRFETAHLDPSSSLGWSPSEEWSYVGAWKLPFDGRAQYVSEFNLWFGFFDPKHLCAVDLSAIDGERPPTVLQVGQDLNLPDEEFWIPIQLELVNLGDGKFLMARIFEIDETSEQFAVFTGIEMIAGVGDDQSLKVVKHKVNGRSFLSGASSQRLADKPLVVDQVKRCTRNNKEGYRQMSLPDGPTVRKASKVKKASTPAVLQIAEMQRLGIERCHIAPEELTEARLLQDRPE